MKSFWKDERDYRLYVGAVRQGVAGPIVGYYVSVHSRSGPIFEVTAEFETEEEARAAIPSMIDLYYIKRGPQS